MSWWERFKAYWTARGVIPRWQLVLVYGAIVLAGMFGLSKSSGAANQAGHAADKAGQAATQAQTAIEQLKVDRIRRARASALSQLSNCKQIEVVKVRLLDTLNDSLRGQRPLAPGQQASVDKFRARFAPRDCYQLPIVVQNGIKRPHRKLHRKRS